MNNNWTTRRVFTLSSLFMVLILNMTLILNWWNLRFHQAYDGRMMLQRHVRCSSVQCRVTIKSYLIDNANFLGKRWCLAFSMHYLTLATLLDRAVPVCTCEMFCFTGMINVLPKIVLILPGADSSSSHVKKKVAKFVYFLETTMYECLIFWIRMTICITLAVNYALFRLGVTPGRLL